jgi:hypothetical protein
MKRVLRTQGYRDVIRLLRLIMMQGFVPRAQVKGSKEK